MTRLATLTVEPELLADARRGDVRAQEALYRRCLPGVRSLARRLVVRDAVADEITQDVFVSLFRHLDDYSGAAPFGAWLRSIVVRRCLSHLRSPWVRASTWLELDAGTHAGEIDDPTLVVDDPVTRSHRETAELERAFASLAPLTRLVVWLHDVEGYTHAEIAAELGRSVSFSKSQLSRAHERLREQLSAWQETVTCTPASTSC